eukprot:TRINITY_DN825_c0_g1_i3.p2 TRINITY_DN825_c0_g1~~TRINITY_DN825_c0_g1_i3.p2  ORF type:complete len:140 (-),score=40.89 TRINITY_DN825_c0_g1_i3:79-498(-)
MQNGPITQFMCSTFGSEISEFLLTLAIGVIAMYWFPVLWRSDSKASKTASYEPESASQHGDEEESDRDQVEDGQAEGELDMELDAIMEGAMHKFYAGLPNVQEKACGYNSMVEVTKQELVAKAIVKFEAEGYAVPETED